MAEQAAEAPAAGPPPTKAQRADRARKDGLRLIAESHDLPYEVAVKSLAVWASEDPVRLAFLAWQLALWHDPNQPPSWLDAAMNTVTLPKTEAA